jgi:hypothetical protein
VRGVYERELPNDKTCCDGSFVCPEVMLICMDVTSAADRRIDGPMWLISA